MDAKELKELIDEQIKEQEKLQEKITDTKAKRFAQDLEILSKQIDEGKIRPEDAEIALQNMYDSIENDVTNILFPKPLALHSPEEREELEKKLGAAWDEALRSFYTPTLRPAEWIPNESACPINTAFFDFGNHATKVSAAFMSQVTAAAKFLDDKTVDYDKLLRGFLKHEIGHFMVFPRKISDMIVLAHWADTMFNKPEYHELGITAQDVYLRYMDVVDNTHLYLHSGMKEDISALMDAADKLGEFHTEPDDIFSLSRFYYRHAHEEPDPIPAEVPEKYKEAYSAMRRINFSAEDRDENGHVIDDFSKRMPRHYHGIYALGEIMKKFPKKKNKSRGGKGSGSSGGKGSGQPGEGEPSDGSGDEDGDGEGDFFTESLRAIDPEELKKAMREIMRNVGKDRAERIKDWIDSHLGNAKVFPRQPHQGIGLEEGFFSVEEKTIEYYRELAKDYKLFVVKKPAVQDEHDPFPERLVPWDIEQPVDTINIFASGGLLLPDITPRWEVGQLIRVDETFKVPDLLLVIDSSGSMPDPAQSKSYGALAGKCIANSYYANEAHIAVINFSGSSKLLDFTRDLDAIDAHIVGYQGGGTTVDMTIVKKTLERKLAPDRLENLTEEEVRKMVDRGELPKDTVQKQGTIKQYDFNETYEVKQQGIDLVIITDGGLSNLDETMNYLHEKGLLHRSTIIHVNRYGMTLPKLPNVAYYIVERDEEMMDIAIGVQRNIEPIKMPEMPKE